MAVNLLEEDRLVYHDERSNTIDIRPSLTTRSGLSFKSIEGFGSQVESTRVNLDHDAVETLRDALTCWLETGKLTVWAKGEYEDTKEE